MPIPHRTRSLAAVPSDLHAHYRELDGGGFILDVDFGPERTRLEKQRDRWRQVAEQHLISERAAAVVERLGVDEMWRATVQRAVAARMRVDLDLDDAHSRPEVIVVDEKGQQASLPDGRTLTPELIGAEVDGEFHRTFSVTWLGHPAAKAANGKPDAQPIDDGRDVRLPPGYSQQQFEAAFKRAMAQGGQVVFDEGEPAPGPASRDVVLERGYTPEQFAIAFEQAQRQGGDVFFAEEL